ncbi:MAG: single-stranded DNA-binding protein [Mycoplasmatota bacterium]
MNKVMLIGRITTKPELRYTSSNLPFTRFSVAINRTFSNQQGQRETDFINVVVWRKQAENVCNFLNKGSQVAIEGRLQSGSYDDKDGKKVYTLDVQADNVQFLESKSQSQTRDSNPSPYDYQNNQGYQSNNVNVDNDPFADFGDSVAIDDNFLD